MDIDKLVASLNLKDADSVAHARRVVTHCFDAAEIDERVIALPMAMQLMRSYPNWQRWLDVDQLLAVARASGDLWKLLEAIRETSGVDVAAEHFSALAAILARAQSAMHP